MKFDWRRVRLMALIERIRYSTTPTTSNRMNDEPIDNSAQYTPDRLGVFQGIERRDQHPADRQDHQQGDHHDRQHDRHAQGTAQGHNDALVDCGTVSTPCPGKRGPFHEPLFHGRRNTR